MTRPGPLAGLRVVEIAGGIPAAFCARLLRGFGADTIRVEVPTDSTSGAAWSEAPMTDDQRVFLVAGARRVIVDGDDGLALLASLVAEADVVVEDQGPGFLASVGIDPEAVLGRQPGQIITSISPLGQTGPRSGWQATNAVQFAVGGLMALTGEPSRAPLVTGGEQAFFLGGLHAWAATTVSLTGRFRTGRGGWIDLSMQEVAASMPELYGAMSEYELGEPVPRSGNSVRSIWGVYHCADGFAGVCCLDRQTKAFFSLLGEPVVSDPRFNDPISRAEHDDELLAHVMSFMSDRTKEELTALSPIHRVPFGAVLTPRELLDDESFAQRDFFDQVVTPSGIATMPGRPFPGLTWTPPQHLDDPIPLGEATLWPGTGSAFGSESASGPESASGSEGGGPLMGLRVLDLTMMWAGPYATKLLVESGAEVIKIESPSAWDNIRTLVPQDEATPDYWNSAYYFNEYNHSKKSLTLDLAEDAGRQVFLRLVAEADVVIENYRAEVLDKLGLGYEVLKAANEQIVLVSMAGFGKTGSLAAHVGFGP
ncbi:MAG: hypothetical protein GY773_08550, partial [Actinomycetia bacterium]|nr:hypothetical protein [Actinomycetes bacterium]